MAKIFEKEGYKGKGTGKYNKHCDKCSKSEIHSDADSSSLNDINYI